MYALTDKVVVITGSGRGIGSEVATLCSQEGAKVVINYLVNSEAAIASLKNIKKDNKSAIAVQADVREPEQARMLIEKAVGEFGRLDILVNNAHTPFVLTDFENITWSMVAEQIDGTLRSSFNCIKLAIPYFKKSGSGVILNISSITSQFPVAGFSHRNIAKAAIEGLTRSLAIELMGSNIRVNALAVGWTDTDQTNSFSQHYLDNIKRSIPMRRFATKKEIAETAIFLISPKSSYMTGSVIPVAGGLQLGNNFD